MFINPQAQWPKLDVETDDILNIVEYTGPPHRGLHKSGLFSHVRRTANFAIAPRPARSLNKNEEELSQTQLLTQGRSFFIIVRRLTAFSIKSCIHSPSTHGGRQRSLR